MVFFTLLGPKNRLIYVDGVYDQNAGKTPLQLTLPPGVHLFETVNGKRQVDYRWETEDLPSGSLREITLVAVKPPEPV